jgi:hypothetical protein
MQRSTGARLMLLALALAALAGCKGPAREQGEPPHAGVQEPEEPVYGPPAPELEQPPFEPPEGWQGPESAPRGILDSVQEGVATRARATAAWIDSFLSDERSLAEANRSWIRLRLDAFSEEREGVDFDARASARLVLPYAEDRFNLVFSGDGQEDLEDEGLLDEDALAVLDEEEEASASLGLQYLLRQTRSNNIRTEVGLRFDGIQPVPYVGGRWRYMVPLLTWNLRLTERLRWYTDVGWESKTGIDLERPLGDSFFLRSSGRVNWFEEEEGLSYSTSMRLYQVLGRAQLLTYEWSNSFETEPEDRLKQVRLRLRWSQRFLREWILLELAPQVTYREDEDYEPALGMLVRFELGFGTQPRISNPRDRR